MYFDRTAYDINKRLFYVPSAQLLTLDDEVMGTRSNENPVKCIFARKGSLDIQCSNDLTDVLFRLTIESRLHRRGETQFEIAKGLLECLTEAKGEISCRTTVLTADREYVRPFLGNLWQLWASAQFL